MRPRNFLSATFVVLGFGVLACGEAEPVAFGHASTFGTCGSCHAIPPDDGPVFTLSGQDKTAHVHHAFTMAIDCGGCHDGYRCVTPSDVPPCRSGSSVNPSLHINGKIDVAYFNGSQFSGWNCLGCH